MSLLVSDMGLLLDQDVFEVGDGLKVCLHLGKLVPPVQPAMGSDHESFRSLICDSFCQLPHEMCATDEAYDFCPKALSKGSNGHDDLPELAALLEIPVRIRHLVEREGAVDDRLQRARLQPLDHELDCNLTSALVAGR
jgi:hypothetical protein